MRTSDSKYKLDHIKLQEPCWKSSAFTTYIDSSCQHFFPFSGSSIPKITQENQGHEQCTSKSLTLQEGICWFETFTLYLKYVPALWDYPYNPRLTVCNGTGGNCKCLIPSTGLALDWAYISHTEKTFWHILSSWAFCSKKTNWSFWVQHSFIWTVLLSVCCFLTERTWEIMR